MDFSFEKRPLKAKWVELIRQMVCINHVSTEVVMIDSMYAGARFRERAVFLDFGVPFDNEGDWRCDCSRRRGRSCCRLVVDDCRADVFGDLRAVRVRPAYNGWGSKVI